MDTSSSLNPEILLERVLGSDVPARSFVNDIYTTPFLMLADFDRASLVRFEAFRSERLLAPALARVEREYEESSSIAHRASSSIDAVMRGISKLECLKAIATNKPTRISEDRVTEEAAWMGMESFVKDLEDVRKRFDTECAEQLVNDPNLNGACLRSALDSFMAIMSRDVRSVRERLNEAFAVFQECLRLNSASVPAAVWFWHGWTLWRLENDPAVAQRAIAEAVRLSGREDSITRWLSCRLLSHMHAEAGDAEAAYESATRAMELRSDAVTTLELAACAAKMNKIRESRQMMGHALNLNPYVALRWLADESCPLSTHDVLDAMATQLPKLRESGQSLCHQWQATSKRVKEVTTQLGRDDIVGSELLDGHHESLRCVAKADLFVAWFIHHSADASKRLLIEQARASVTREIDRCEQLRQESEAAVETIQKTRDESLREIQTSRDRAVTAVRAAVRNAMKYEAMLDQGCGVSLGIAVTGFGVFAVIAAIGVIRGFAFGIDTTLGKVGLGLTLSPMILFLSAQMAQGIAAMRIEAEVQRRVDAIDAEARKKFGVADTAYREQITTQRQLLDDRSKEVRMCREAIKRLQAGSNVYEPRERAA